MMDIVLTRIDDRLIHGQVVTAWAKITKATRIVVVDDEVAGDDFMVRILKMAAASFKIDILSVTAASELLKNDAGGDRVIVLVKRPETVEALIEKGVVIKDLNLGGMGAILGRKQLYRNISISEEEKQCFRHLMERGVHIYVQIVPDASAIDIKTLF